MHERIRRTKRETTKTKIMRHCRTKRSRVEGAGEPTKSASNQSINDKTLYGAALKDEDRDKEQEQMKKSARDA